MCIILCAINVPILLQLKSPEFINKNQFPKLNYRSKSYLWSSIKLNKRLTVFAFVRWSIKVSFHVEKILPIPFACEATL